MTCVFIEQLEIRTVIGVFEWEKAIKQKLIIDLDCYLEDCAAGQSDELVDALDYAAVTQAIQAFAAANHFNLVEALAEQLMGHLLETFSIDKIAIRIAKPGAINGAKSVGVKMERVR